MFSERLLVCDDVVSAGTADRHSGLPQAGGLLQSPGLRHLWVTNPVFGLVLMVAYVESKIKYFEPQLSEEKFLDVLSAELRETDNLSISCSQRTNSFYKDKIALPQFFAYLLH